MVAFTFTLRASALALLTKAAAAALASSPSALVELTSAGQIKTRGAQSHVYGPADVDASGAGSVVASSRQLAVAHLFAENGTVQDVLPPFGAPTSGESGSCNGAYDHALGLYFKISADAKLLAVDAESGAVAQSVALHGDASVPPLILAGGVAFLAGPDERGLVYGASPLERTSYSIFSFNATSGLVALVSTQPKGQMDGLGVCVGFMRGGSVSYIFKNKVVAFDLQKKVVSDLVPYFAAPLAIDPTQPDTALTVFTSGGPRAFNTTLARVDLATGRHSALYTWNNTYYEKLCHCTLPIRAQDQADLAVSADGSRVWVVLSYNSKPKDHRSGITRGAFVLDVAGASATLASAAEAWTDMDTIARPHIAMIRVQY